MQAKLSVFNRLLPGLALVLASVCTVPAALAQYVAAMETVESEALMNNVAVGQSLQLNNVLLDGESTPVTLTLERFEVFAPNAQIVVHGPEGEDRLPQPPVAYFNGTIQGQPDSLAVLSAHPQGAMRGIVQHGGKFWIVAGGRETDGPLRGLASRELRRSGLSNAIKPVQCHIDQLPEKLRKPRPLTGAMPLQPLAAGQFYDVRVAIETDGEFFALFNDSSAATAYIGDLFAYASTIYQQEASTRLTVGDVSLWSGGAASDPWNHTSTVQGLTNFQNYWNSNKKSVSRTIAHFLSARQLGGGVAYVGALCDKEYGYGYSAEIQGVFQLTNPRPVWDIIVASHEIGHNFNSPHTHCYNNIGGNSNPVDGCYSKEDGCWNGAESLPGVNSLTGGTEEAGDGTIMSYCHQLGGSLANISLTFGQNHSRGVAPSRVSNQISSYVAATASANPSCITISGGVSSYTLTLASAGTGSGTVSGASSYVAGATVNLTATPASGSTFAGWSPSPCASSFTMPASNLTCTATFNIASSNSTLSDYNGDGKSDLIWRNSTTGQIYGMLLDGTVISQQAMVYQEPNTAWQIIHNGDFDGNGKNDLLWWNNQTGQVYLMPMNGLSMAGGALIHQEPNTAWQVVAVGDLNGDGKADLVWWNNQTGQVYGMLMNGAARIQEALIYQEPNTGWRILAARDFTGDQKADLLWRNTTTGQVYLMSMNGLSITGGAIIHQVSNPAWSIVAVGDLSGDGKADLVWRNSQTGEVYGMLMNGFVISAQGGMYTEPNTAWQIVGSGDYNGDSRTDLLWRNSSTGQIYQMLMNGLSVAGGAVIYQEANSAWQIVAALP